MDLPQAPRLGSSWAHLDHHVPLMEPTVAFSLPRMQFARVLAAPQPQGSMGDREQPGVLSAPSALKAQRGRARCAGAGVQDGASPVGAP